MRLATVIGSLVALSLSACAAPEQDETDEGTGAIETGAAYRSKLKVGMYGNETVMLGIYAQDVGGLRALINANPFATTSPDHRIITGKIDVALDGKVALKSQRCTLGLEVEGDEVTLVPEGGNEVDCLTKKIRVSFHPLEALAGSYACVSGTQSPTKTVMLSSVTKSGVDVSLVSARAEATRRFKAKFIMPWHLLTEQGSADSIMFLHTETFLLREEDSSAVCTLTR